jgi:hypothetical protein
LFADFRIIADIYDIGYIIKRISKYANALPVTPIGTFSSIYKTGLGPIPDPKLYVALYVQ